MKHLLLATSNTAKLARLRWLVDGLSLIACTATDLGIVLPSVAEDSADFAANAAGKALAWSQAADGLLTLASDGGLDIPALGTAWQAVRTRRNAGPEATDAQRIQHLLYLMKNLHGPSRHAFWHEALALAEAGVIVQTWSATGDGGEIVADVANVPERDDTFWTERVRYYPSAGKLYCELSPQELTVVNSVWPRLRQDVRRFLLRSVLGEGTAESSL
jgi:inosine/xanthosine triphosphate pyrophosphatase family protein